MFEMLDEATLTVETVQERLKVFTENPDFRFLEGPHQYWLGKQLLTSATSVAKKYKKPFERDKQAAITAQYTGQTVEEVIAEWERSGWIGSRMHEYIEWTYDGIMPAGYFHEDPEVALRCRKFLKIRDARLKDFIPVGQELRMFYEPTALAGTLDFLAFHKPTGKLWVLDWKSNKAIRTDKDGARYGNFFEPFTDIICNEHNEYSMQIAIYRLFLESVGIPTAGGVIVHIPTGSQEAKIYPVRDFRERLRFIFEK